MPNVVARTARWLMAVVLIAAASAPGAAAKPHPKRISAAAAFSLPAAKQCVSGRKLTLTVRKLAHVRWTGATVKINGRVKTSIKRSQIGRPVTLTGLPATAFTFSITARTSDHRSVTATRAYHPCAPAPAPAPQPAPSPTPTPLPSPPGATTPGSYSGSDNQSRGVTLYVSADGAHVQDVSVPVTYLQCAPGGAFYDQLNVADIPIAADGSFTATTTQDGVLTSSPAHYTYTFSGRFSGTTAAGTLREDVTYNDGTVHTCSTNDQSFSVRRDTQGSQALTTPAAGSYAGSDNQSRGVTLYVSAGGSHLQDVSVPVAYLACSPGSAFYDQLNIADIPIAADGSFTATTTQNGVLNTSVAQYTYRFKGHFHGVDANGVPRLAGTLREDITYNDGTARSCTTDEQSFYLARQAQGSQTPAPPAPGSYSGSDNQSRGVLAYVSADGSHLQDVSVPVVYLACSPGSAFYDQLNVGEIPIAADGSFSATVTDSGVLFASAASYTYTFKGHFHGVDANGIPRLAGTLREDVTYNDGTARTCTSNEQSFYLARQAQGSQTPAPPAAGSYTGSDNQSRGLSFTVSAAGTHLQTLSVPVTYLQCTPSTSFYDQLNIADIPIAADGSFTATTTSDGVLNGHAAHFTYTFTGHFHGFNSNGVQRAAGTLREDITYTNGSAFSCTTDPQSWSANRSG